MENTKSRLYRGSIQPVLGVIIGQSNGFPHGLDTILSHLNETADKILFSRETLPLSVIVAVHHEPFIDSSVGGLIKYCPRLEPRLLEDGMKVGRNGVYFCKGRMHTGVDKYHGYSEVRTMKSGESFGPNIDYLVITATDYFKRINVPKKIPVIGVILSGMVQDGALGAVYVMNSEDSLLLIQDPASCSNDAESSMPLQTLARLYLLEQGVPWEKLPPGILPVGPVLRHYNEIQAVREGKVVIAKPEEIGPLIIKKMRENL
ncbi:hypothetical protein HYU13_06460 [Candidatus Woesearchaeota archaeon]|nr:hypothetical protein [Candidatus Woesearchaeota archaeon]